MNAPVFEFSDDELRKLAREILRDPFRPLIKSAQAALGDAPSLVGKCLYAVNEVINDDRYLTISAEEQAKGVEVAGIPTKQQTLVRIWETADKGLPSDRIKALELFCKVAGYLEPPKAANVTINPAVHVMEVPVSTTNDEWESKLKQNQEALMKNGSTSIN